LRDKNERTYIKIQNEERSDRRSFGTKSVLNQHVTFDTNFNIQHEMIHAYLFVTRNNRDRDGHGPEFTKVKKFGI